MLRLKRDQPSQTDFAGSIPPTQFTPLLLDHPQKIYYRPIITLRVLRNLLTLLKKSPVRAVSLPWSGDVLNDGVYMRYLVALLVSTLLVVSTGTAMEQTSKKSSGVKALTAIFANMGLLSATQKSVRNVPAAADNARENALLAAPKKITKYGYNLFKQESASGAFENISLRAGASAASRKAVYGVELIMNW